MKTLEVGDDYGDNCTTFYCKLPKGHEGKHKETGKTDGIRYSMEWD